MLSIEQIRRDPEYVRQALATRGEEGPLDELLTLDSQRRQAISQGDELRARRNQASGPSDNCVPRERKPPRTLSAK